MWYHKENFPPKRRIPMNIWLRYLLCALGGALVGLVYQYFFGCVDGTCPITASPVNTALYFALVGLLMPTIFAPRKKKSE